MKKFRTLMMAAVIAFAGHAQAIEPGVKAPEFKATDIHGKSQSISQYAGKVVVLEWTNPGCPFVKKFYEPGAMQAHQNKAKTDGVIWISVNSGANGKEGHMTADEAKKQTAEVKSGAASYIIDESGAIGKQYGAAATPTIVVIGKDGKVVYFGAPDDKATSKSSDITGATSYLDLAIEAAKAGKTPVTASTKAYGCSVKYAE